VWVSDSMATGFMASSHEAKLRRMATWGNDSMLTPDTSVWDEDYQAPSIDMADTVCNYET